MVIISENTPSESDGTDTSGTDTTTDGASDSSDTTSNDHDPSGPVGMAVEWAQTLADLVSPFATLLTAAVQAVTVWKLVGNSA